MKSKAEVTTGPFPPCILITIPAHSNMGRREGRIHALGKAAGVSGEQLRTARPNENTASHCFVRREVEFITLLKRQKCVVCVMCVVCERG